tara:strand:- start:830 stop:1006 length:177 start_codon:yes stop_codon:yes gene_type:complete
MVCALIPERFSKSFIEKVVGFLYKKRLIFLHKATTQIMSKQTFFLANNQGNKFFRKLK